MKTLLKISKTSKMPCPSWSLEAVKTCPGSRKPDGNLVDACSKCYADKGFYKMKPAKNLRIHNKQDWKTDDWVPEMVSYLRDYARFRWFDSGDMYALPLAKKILQVCEQTPWVEHWIPTRQHKFAKFMNTLNKLKALPNVSVRFSSDSIDGEYTKGLHGSTILPSAYHKTDAFVCQAFLRGGKCGDCRACWDKSIPLIGYPIH